jgi:hypothetical protein
MSMANTRLSNCAQLQFGEAVAPSGASPLLARRRDDGRPQCRVADVFLERWKRGLGDYDAWQRLDWARLARAGAMTKAPRGGKRWASTRPPAARAAPSAACPPLGVATRRVDSARLVVRIRLAMHCQGVYSSMRPGAGDRAYGGEMEACGTEAFSPTIVVLCMRTP